MSILLRPYFIANIFVSLYAQLLALKKNQPDHWVDYGCLCLFIGDNTKVLNKFSIFYFALKMFNFCIFEEVNASEYTKPSSDLRKVS